MMWDNGKDNVSPSGYRKLLFRLFSKRPTARNRLDCWTGASLFVQHYHYWFSPFLVVIFEAFVDIRVTFCSWSFERRKAPLLRTPFSEFTTKQNKTKKPWKLERSSLPWSPTSFIRSWRYSRSVAMKSWREVTFWLPRPRREVLIIVENGNRTNRRWQQLTDETTIWCMGSAKKNSKNNV